jgi:hypothetical protein
MWVTSRYGNAGPGEAMFRILNDRVGGIERRLVA